MIWLGLGFVYIVFVLHIITVRLSAREQLLPCIYMYQPTCIDDSFMHST